MTGPLKILHIEDSELDAEIINWRIVKGNFEFLHKVVDNRNDFESALKDFEPDVILSDHSLPSFDSVTALEITLKEQKKIPFILVTGSVSEEFAVEIIKKGAYDYILKSRMDRLPSAITNAAEKGRLENEKQKFLNEQEATAKLLKESEKLARLGSWQINLETYEAKWSDEAYHIFGLEPGEIEPSYNGFLSFIHPDDLEHVMQKTAESELDGRDEIKFNFRIISKCGQVKYIRNELIVRRNGQGKVVGLVGFNMDVSENVLAENEASKKDRFYKKLIEKSADMTILFVQGGTILYGSQAISTILGYEQEEFVGYDCKSFIHPDELPELLAKIEESYLDSSKSFSLQARVKSKTRGYLWCAGNVTNLLDDPDVNAIVANFRDITENKISVQNLKQSKSHLMASQRIGNIGSWELEILGTDVQEVGKSTWSDQMYRVYGYEPQECEVSIDFFLRSVHPDDQERVQELASQAIMGDAVYSLEHRIVRKDGEVRFVQGTAEIIRDPKTGIPVKMIGVVQDITERKLATDALRKSEANLRAIFENPDISYILLDAELNVISFNTIANHNFTRDLGIPLMEGKSILDYTKPERKEIVANSYNNVLVSGQSIGYEASFTNLAGSVFWIYFQTSPVSDENGNTMGLVMVMTNVTERRLSEEKLLQSQAHLLASQRIGNVGSWELSLLDAGTYKYGKTHWSDQTYRIFGYEPGEVEISTELFVNMVHPDDRKRIQTATRNAIAEDIIYESEHRIIRKDGEIRCVQNRAEVIRDPNTGGPLKMIGVVQDITERKESEDALRNSEANMRAIFENPDISYVLLDADLNTWSFNKLAFKYFNNASDIPLVIGRHFLDYVPAGRKAETLDLYKKVLNGKSHSYEANFTGLNGETIWMNFQLSPVKDNTGKALGMVVVHTDITERKNLELQREQITRDLLRSEINLRNILENTEINYILLDTELNIISFNRLAFEGFKKDIGKQISEGKNIIDFIKDDKKEKVKEQYTRVVRGEHLNYETDYERVDGSMVWYNMNLSAVAGPEQKPLGMLMAITDVSSRKKMEQERDNLIKDIVQRNQDLEQFTYIISHNLRAPVANIMGFSEILHDKELEDNDRKFIMDGLDISIKKLDHVILDLNDILKVKNSVDGRKEKVIFSELVSDIESAIESTIIQEKVKIETQFLECEGMMVIKGYLYSIFMNLITNSIKYAKPAEPPMISITSHLTNTGIRLIFKDNGIGIDMAKNANHVFGLYKRFSNHTEGKGMGLFMVKTQVETLGGKIHLVSEPGKGSEFIIDFKK